MSDKEEGEEGEFTSVMSKKEKRAAAKSQKAKSPSPTPPIPDTIGGNEKKRKGTAKKPRIEEGTTSETTATATSGSGIPEKNPSEEEKRESDQNESTDEQTTTRVISPASPVVFLSASNASKLREETLQKSNPGKKKRTAEVQRTAKMAEIEIDYGSENRKIGGRVLMFHMSNKQNVAIRTAGHIGTKKVWLSKKHRI